jgi:hypothetical protein
MAMGILKYKLPEEKSEFELAQAAGGLYSDIYTFEQWLRSVWKYSDKKELTVQEIRDKFYEVMQTYQNIEED